MPKDRIAAAADDDGDDDDDDDDDDDVKVWKQIAFSSARSFNWMLCITETESVYCAVRTDCLNNIRLSLWMFTGQMFLVAGE